MHIAGCTGRRAAVGLLRAQFEDHISDNARTEECAQVMLMMRTALSCIAKTESIASLWQLRDRTGMRHDPGVASASSSSGDDEEGGGSVMVSIAWTTTDILTCSSVDRC